MDSTATSCSKSPDTVLVKEVVEVEKEVKRLKIGVSSLECTCEIYIEPEKVVSFTDSRAREDANNILVFMRQSVPVVTLRQLRNMLNDMLGNR